MKRTNKQIFAYIIMGIFTLLFVTVLSHAQTIEKSPYHDLQRQHIDNKQKVVYGITEKVFMHYEKDTEIIVRDEINPIMPVKSIIKFSGDVIMEYFFDDDDQLVRFSSFTVNGYNLDGDKVFYDVTSKSGKSYAFIIDLKLQSFGVIYRRNSTVRITFADLKFIGIEAI